MPTPELETGSNGRVGVEQIFFRRNSDGSLDRIRRAGSLDDRDVSWTHPIGSLAFPDDMRAVSADDVRVAEHGAEGGALIWAIAFEELGPIEAWAKRQFDGLSLPGPGGSWRTEAQWCAAPLSQMLSPRHVLHSFGRR